MSASPQTVQTIGALSSAERAHYEALKNVQNLEKEYHLQKGKVWLYRRYASNSRSEKRLDTAEFWDARSYEASNELYATNRELIEAKTDLDKATEAVEAAAKGRVQ